MLLLSTEAPGGIYNGAQLSKIAELCEKDAAIVKATEDQRLALFVPEKDALLIAKELGSVGLGIRHYQEGLHQPTACIGELCPLHKQDALGAAMDVTQSLGSFQLSGPLRIGINGCGRCCVPSHTLDMSIVGEEEGYRISVGGKNSHIPEMATFLAEGIPPGELAQCVNKLVSIYKSEAKDETLQELMERIGTGLFIKALSPYSQDGFQSDGGGTEDLLEGDGAPERSESSGESDTGVPLEMEDETPIHEMEEETPIPEIEEETPMPEMEEETPIPEMEEETLIPEMEEETPIPEIEEETPIPEMEEETPVPGMEEASQEDGSPPDDIAETQELSQEEALELEQKIVEDLEEESVPYEDPEVQEERQALSQIVEEDSPTGDLNDETDSWAIASIQFASHGVLQLRFENGTEIELGEAFFKGRPSQTLHLGGQSFEANLLSDRIQVGLDGLKLSFPRKN